MVDLVRLVFLFDMPVILLFALLVLFHEHTQLVGAKANYSVAIPLAIRSPYLSCWLPELVGAANATSYDAPAATAPDLSQVCSFSRSNAAINHDPIIGSRLEICVSSFVSMAASIASLDQLPT